MSASTIIAKTFQGNVTDTAGTVTVNTVDAFTVDTANLILPQVPNGGAGFVTSGVNDINVLSSEFVYQLIDNTAIVSFQSQVVWQTSSGSIFVDLPVELVGGRVFTADLQTQRIPCIGLIDLNTVSNVEVFVEAIAGGTQLRVMKFSSLGI